MRNKETAINKLFADANIKPQYFTVGQICKASGFSRATLLKLEQEGYLEPRKIDPQTGYRYYDCFNLYEIQQYQLLRTIGLSKTDVFRYFNGELDTRDLLKRMKDQLSLLQRSVEEMSLRINKEENFSFTMLELKEVTCYCKTNESVTPNDTAYFTYHLLEEVVSAGFRYAPNEPLFSIRGDTRTNPAGHPDKPFHTTVCVPIDPESIKNQSTEYIRVIPGCTAFSIVYYGSHEKYQSINQALSLLWQEVENRGLTPTGPVRILGIVAPYTGMQFELADHVYRFAVPISDANQPGLT